MAKLKMLVNNLERTELSNFNSQKNDNFQFSWNKKIDFVPSKNFFQLFEDQVKKNPSSIAVVVDKKNMLSYKELDIQSNKLAIYLKCIGINKGDVIGLGINNGLNLIISILGILKSGGVYLPLDINYPKKYLESMLIDAKPKLIITHSKIFTFCKNKISILNLDKELKKINNIKINKVNNFKKNIGTFVKLNDLAYIIYTSGSTGNPKGIMISHRSLPNIFLSRRNFYPANIKALISGGICFDANLLVIFYTLLSGGCLYLCNNKVHKTNNDLCNFIKKNAINFMISVPSLYLKLLENLNKFLELKVVSLTGENIPYSLCIKHSKIVPNAVLYNEYGPSEYSIGTTIAEMYSPFKKIIKKICVGKPLINTQVYILDGNQNVLPVGYKGEICISGVGIAKGYLNNKNLTKEKFIEFTFLDRKKCYLYKTGDLGRFLPNGDLEFLGRIDNQVQIYDHKINLGEIEHAILQHPEIKGVIVVVNEKYNKLIAYISTSFQKFVDFSLKDYLINILPNYMIPSKFIYLNEFPLSVNGKIDKKALLKCYSLISQKEISKNCILINTENYLNKSKKKKNLIKQKKEDLNFINSNDIKFIEVVANLKNKILKRGNLPYVSMKKQFEYVDNLSNFPLGRFLIKNKYFNSFWIDYIIKCSVNKSFYNKFSKCSLENFILNRSLLINAWKELFKNFQILMQKELKENITLASIPCGLMRDIFSLDYSRVLNFTLIGVDIDKNILSSAYKLSLETNYFEKIKFVQRDAWKLQYNNELDVITSCGLNIYESNKKKVLDLYFQFYKALKLGGSLIIGFLTFPPNKEKLSEWNLNKIQYKDFILEKILFEDILDLNCYNFRTSEQIKKELKNVGFKKIKFYYDKLRVFPVVVAKK